MAQRYRRKTYNNISELSLTRLDLSFVVRQLMYIYPIKLVPKNRIFTINSNYSMSIPNRPTNLAFWIFSKFVGPCICYAIDENIRLLYISAHNSTSIRIYHMYRKHERNLQTSEKVTRVYILKYYYCCKLWRHEISSISVKRWYQCIQKFFNHE